MLAPTIEPHASTGRMTSATRARQIFASVTKSSICTTPYRWPRSVGRGFHRAGGRVIPATDQFAM